MKAFIIAYNNENKLVRIYDMSPSARVKVFDYPLKTVKDAVESGKIVLDQTKVEKGKLVYQGEPISELPDWCEPRDSNVLFALEQVYLGDNKFGLLCIDINGNILTVDFDDARRQGHYRLSNAEITVNTGYGLVLTDLWYITAKYKYSREIVPITGTNILDASYCQDNCIVVQPDIDAVINAAEDATIKIESRKVMTSYLFKLEVAESKRAIRKVKKIEFLGDIDEILPNAIGNVNVTAVWGLPKHVKKIHKNGISNISIDTANMYDYSETELRKGVLWNSNIGLLVLPHNLDKISEEAMENSTFGSVYFPPSIRYITPELLPHCDINTSIVVKGSYAHKTLSRSRKTKLKIFDSEQDVLEYLKPKMEDNSDNKIDRLIMAFGSSDDAVIQDILKPEYEKSASKLLAMYNKLCITEGIKRDKVKLDTSKLKIPGLAASDFAGGLLDDIRNTQDTGTFDLEGLSNTFCILCNYITSNSESLNDILTKEITSRTIRGYAYNPDPLKKPGCYSNILRSCYSDGRATIFNLELIYDTNFISGYTEANLLIIVIDGKVVYITACKQVFGTYFGSELNAKLWSGDNDGFDACELLHESDLLSMSSKSQFMIDSTIVPNSLSQFLLNKLNEQLIIAYISCGKTKTPNSSCIYLSVLSGTLIDMQTSYITEIQTFLLPNLSINNMAYQSLSIKGIYKYGEWPNQLKKKLVNNFFLDSSSSNLIKCAFMGDAGIEELKSKPGAYDSLEPCYEWKLARALTKLGIDSWDQVNKKYAMAILNSAYFRPTTAKAIKGKDRDYTDKVLDIPSEGLKLYVDHIELYSTFYPIVGIYPNYLYHTVSTDKKIDKKYFYSSINPTEIIDTIKSLYDPGAQEIGYVTDSPIYGRVRPDSVSIIQAGMQSAWVDRGLACRIDLAMSKSTGQIYLLAMMEAEDKYTILFRLKNNLSNAMKTQYYRLSVKPSKLEFIDLSLYVTDIREEGYGFQSGTKLVVLRDGILAGNPNGYAPNNPLGMYSDFLAKQPDWAKDNPIKGIYRDAK